VHDGSAVLLGADAAHLSRALRVQPGELVVVVEAGHVEHGLRVEAVSSSRVVGRIAWSRPVTGEPSRVIHVLQAIPARGMELAIEALVEAGTAAIWPVLTARGRIERWRAVARESAQLAGRARPPEVHELLPLPEAVESVSASAQLLACVVDQVAAPLSGLQLQGTPAITLAVGPEGGFDAADRAVLQAAGATEVHLGPRVLPVWLAGAVAVSLLLAAGGDLDTPVAASLS